jgi:alkylhydroperoxidase/carboxymuconolactone decarboxylase family protein YurZ
MATESRPRTNADIMHEAAPQAHDAFMAMRKALNEAGPLPAQVRELIVASNFATHGMHGGFLTHGGRALEYGASVEELRHAVLVTLGANTTFGRVAEALTWVDELAAKR